MKLFKLLEGLYTELKTFNSNVEYFNSIKNNVQRSRANPLKFVADIDVIRFKLWLRKSLAEKNITLADKVYASNVTLSFIEGTNKQLPKAAVNLLCASLGYDCFDDLFEAYRETKGAVI